MKWKRSGRKQSWPNRGTIPALPGGTERHHENRSHDSRCPAEIRAQHYPKSSLDRYRRTNGFSKLSQKAADFFIN
jgi:hypothetical protein